MKEIVCAVRASERPTQMDDYSTVYSSYILTATRLYTRLHRSVVLAATVARACLGVVASSTD